MYSRVERTVECASRDARACSWFEQGTEETVKVELAYRRDRDVFPNTHEPLPTISRDGQ